MSLWPKTWNEIYVEVILFGLPGQVERVDRYAMATDPRSRIERHEPERLGAGCVDNFPNIDTHAMAKHGKFIDQGYVDASESILQELGHFGDSGRTHGYHLIH